MALMDRETQPMTKQSQRRLASLENRIIGMGRMVEDAVDKAISALVSRLPDLAREVIVSDEKLDEEEVAIEQMCFELLCLQQPVAVDARFILTTLKVNNDLERMGDLAVNIAERAAFLAVREPIPVPLSFAEMAEAVRGMVRESLQSLVNRDTARAAKVCRADDDVDLMNTEMYVALQLLMSQYPETIERAIHTLSASRHLERIGDLATNIAEDVVFLVDGRIVRHRVEDYLAGTPKRQRT
jgi:phosphate transport system protein